MINNVIISQERYNELKLKADLCLKFKKSAEEAMKLASEAHEMAYKLIDDVNRLTEENNILKTLLSSKEKEIVAIGLDMNTLSAENGLLRGLKDTAFKTEEPKKEAKEITNAEKYKNEIEWLEKTSFGGHTGLGFSLAVLKDTGNPANCYDISCDDCAFCRFDDKSPYSMMGCSECREYWLQQPADKEDK